MAEFSALNDEIQQEQVTCPFNEFNTTIERQKLIAVITTPCAGLRKATTQRLLSQMTSWGNRRQHPNLESNPEKPPRRMKGQNLRHPPNRTAHRVRAQPLGEGLFR